MTRCHPVSCRPRQVLLTTILSAVFGTLQAAADDLGYPPPPGPYRSESSMPRPAQLPVEPATPDPVDSGTRAVRGSAGLLPLPADTFSARDTADILFGSVPTLPPSTAEPHDPAQQTIEDNAPRTAVHPGTAVPGTPAGDRDGWSMDSNQEMQAPAYPDPGMPGGRLQPPPEPAYPGYRQPAASYYRAYPNQFENQYRDDVPTDAYQAPYPPSEPYGIPATPQHVPDAAQFVPGNAMPGYEAGFEKQKPPTGTPEAAAADIFRPAEQN